MTAVILFSVTTLSAAAPVAGTKEEIAAGLERSIERASEKGQNRQVQALRLNLAEHYAATGSYALAARQYELLLAWRPSRAERVKYFIELGKMRDADQNYGAAIQAYQDALHDDADSWDGNLYLARAYHHSELNSKAIEVYKRCIQMRPSAPEPYYEVARVYQQAGFLNKAIEHYQKSLSRKKTAEAYLGLADVSVRQGNIARAKDILQEAKSLLPRADYDVRLGEIYHRHGEWKNACSAWEEALKADAKRDDVRLHLALVYDRLSRSGDSDRMFKQLLTTYPLSPVVHFSRAWVLYARGDRNGSKAEALMVQQLGPTPVVGHYNDELLAQLQKRS